jgi:alkanesulfonate monooxygenase SsuD/methylene tetrahydromethanopterin reductase-like flavin-dependent oxidoreductase (luciferase family)
MGLRLRLRETTEKWTQRYLGMFAGFGGTTPKPVGTPEMVVDVLKGWWRERGIDGFNIACESLPRLIHYLKFHLWMLC